MELRTYSIQVSIRDTDATGSVYCPRAIDWAIKGFEECMNKKPKEIPIVKAEIEWFSSARWGDDLLARLSLVHLGQSSFWLETLYSREEKPIVRVQLIHVLKNGSARAYLESLFGPIEEISPL